MKQLSLVLGFCLAFVVGTLVHTQAPPVQAAAASPATGWTIHIDAKKHFGAAHPNEIAHHYCKNVTGMIECQIYDSDAPNANLVAVETILQPNVYHSLPASEQPLWHYHRTEIPRVDAKIIGMSAADQKKLIAAMMPTYGKVFVLYDPLSTNNLPTGRPWVSIPR